LELDERKLKILQAIIRNYLETGEPVGSRTISKYTDLNLSSATIRNEMADLEELGYILQPHTSAGRIPSDKGYRLYVDHMMDEKKKELDHREKELDEFKDFLDKKVDKIDTLLQNMAKILAANTNYAAMISGPQYHRNKLKFVQLSIVSGEQLLCVVVLDGNVIKNRIVDISDELNDEDVLKLNILLNSSLTGLSVEEINIAVMQKMTSQAGKLADVLRKILEVIGESIAEEGEPHIYTSGATNFFRYPELSDSARASELISILEEKQQLTHLIKNSEEDNMEIQVYIGNETPVQTMKDCSVVTATYELEDGMKGTIGVIGPKRMDYEKVVETLKTVKEQLDTIYKK